MRLSLFRSTLRVHEFVGFANFKRLANDDLFIKAVSNTFLYALLIVPAVVIVSMITSSIIYQKNRILTAIYRGIFYLPTIASAVTVSVVWYWIFNPVIGIANHVLSWFNIEAIAWFSSRTTAFYCVALVSFLCSIGQPIILYTAALGGISREYYDASSIEGASQFQQFLFITVPLLKSTTIFNLVITSINAFQIFIPVQLLTGGGPVNSTTSIIYELYTTAFTYKDFGYASAMGMILFLILGMLAIAQFKLMKEKN